MERRGLRASGRGVTVDAKHLPQSLYPRHDVLPHDSVLQVATANFTLWSNQRTLVLCVFSGVSEVGERFIFRHTSRAFDLDFHGLVRVRLVDAAARDIEAVSRQIGVQPDESLERDADIIVNHLPHDIELPADAWMVGAESAADSEHLFIRKAPTDGWTRIRFRPDHCIEIDRSQKSGRIDLLTQMLAHGTRRYSSWDGRREERPN